MAYSFEGAISGITAQTAGGVKALEKYSSISSAGLAEAAKTAGTNKFGQYNDMLAAKESIGSGGLIQNDTDYYNSLLANKEGEYRDGIDTYVTTGDEQSSESGESEGVKWPTPSEEIMGLPIVVGPEDYGSEMYKVFEQSFPIMIIKPFKMTRSNMNDTFKKGEFENVPGGCYKFALMNDGGVTLNVTNTYEPSTIENQFKSLAENTFGLIGEVNQIVQNNRALGGPVGQGLTKVRNTTDEVTTKMHEMFMQQLGAVQANSNDNALVNYGTDVAQAAGDIVNMFARGLLLGNRIDIPNIWKGSSGGLSCTVKIDLRAHCVGTFDGSGGDDEYMAKIVTPLKVLMALSCPLRKTDGSVEGALAYENPPYLDVEIDKTFTSRCCAITQMSVSADYKDEGYYKSRPMHMIVTLTLKDMYDVFVWDNKATSDEAPAVGDDTPSSAMVINRLVEPENGDGIPENVLDITQHGPNGIGGFEFGANMPLSNLLGSTTSSLLGNLVESTTGIFDDVTESLFSPITAVFQDVPILNDLTTGLLDAYKGQIYNQTIGAGISKLNDTIHNTITSGDYAINQAFGAFASGPITDAMHKVEGAVLNSVIGENGFFSGAVADIRKSVPRVSQYAGRKFFGEAQFMREVNTYEEIEADVMAQVDRATNMVYSEYQNS